MAEEEEGKVVLWPDGAEKVEDPTTVEFLMCGNKSKPIMKFELDRLNELVEVNGESMPAIQGGTTAAAAVALPAGPTGQNRWFDASWGYWKYNNTVLKNPLGTDGIPEGWDGKLYWNGTTTAWSISKVQKLPMIALNDVVKNEDLKESTGKNKFNPLAVVDDFFVKIDDNYKVTGQSGLKMSDPIDISDNDALKKIAVSGIPLGSWDRGWRINDETGALLKGGSIARDLSQGIISYTDIANGLAKTFQITLFTGRSGEVFNADTVQIEKSGTVTSYEKYTGIISEIKGSKLLSESSTYAAKTKSNPVANDDISNKSYVDGIIQTVSKVETVVFKDKANAFGTYNAADDYSSDSKVGWFRKDVSGQINSITINVSQTANTPNPAIFRIGYFESNTGSSFNESTFTELAKVTVQKASLPTSNTNITLSFPTINVPQGKGFAVLGNPLKVHLFKADNPNFASGDPMLLFMASTVTNGNWSYGYKYSYGMTVSYVNTDLMTSISKVAKSPSYKLGALTFVALGDSITQAVDSWARQAILKMQFNGINLAVSGARYADYSNTVIDLSGDQNNNNNTFFNQVLRLAQMTTAAGEQIVITQPVTGESFSIPTSTAVGLGNFPKPDIIVIAMSTNDTAIDTVDEILNIKDMSWSTLNRSANLVYGMRWGFEALKCLYPNAQIIVATPIQTYGGGTRPYAATNKKRLRLIETANYYSIPVIDAFMESGIQEKFEILGNGRYLADGLHPNDNGKALMRDYFINKINQIVFNRN